MFAFINRAKLTTKFLIPILFALLVVLGIGGNFIITDITNNGQRTLATATQALKTEQLSARENNLKALKSKADVIGLFMTKTAPELILSYDFTLLKEYQAIASSDLEVAYSAYLKPDKSPMVDFKKSDSKDIVEHSYPIDVDGEILGYVLLGMSKALTLKASDVSNQRIELATTTLKEKTEHELSRIITIIGAAMIFIFVITIAISVFLFRIFVVNPINETTDILDALAQGKGDLTVVLPVKYDDEIGFLRKKLNNFVSVLHEMIASVVTEVNTLNDSAEQLEQFSSDLSVNSDAQSNETSQVATAMNEMSSSVEEVANHADSTADSSNSGYKTATLGHQHVADTVNGIRNLSQRLDGAAVEIQHLKEDTDKISMILEVINGIAEQTNLLALNAAIEAARAGEQGRGFAVVADEVRTLASKTHESTLEIRETIEKVQQGTNNAVKAMENGQQAAASSVSQAETAGESLKDILTIVSSISEMTTQIAHGAREQSTVANEINENISRINLFSEKTNDGAVQTAKSSHELSSLAARLHKMLGQFKI